MYDANGAALVIRPMGIGEILDTGFRLARSHYRFLVMLIAQAVVPAFVVGALLVLLLPPSVNLGSFVIGIGDFIAGLAVTIACARLLGPSESAASLESGVIYAAAGGRILPAILYGIMVVILAIPLTILFPLGIYLLVRWAMSWVALVVDRDGPIESLRRSWRLTQGNWWHTLGVIIVAGILLVLIDAIVSGLFGAIGAVLLIALGSIRLLTLFTDLGGVIGTLLTLPFSAAISVVLYYELKARNEGNDLAERAQQLPPLE